MSQSTEELRAAITELQSLPRSELVSRYCMLYRSEPPQQISRDLLLRALSFRLQEQAFGGSRPALQRRLRSLAGELRQTGAIAVKGSTTVTTPVKPGTRLIREWQGVVHEVSVCEGGFVYRDQRYRSLSQIARAITGIRWSGPAFFGLNGVGAGKGARNDVHAQDV